MPIRAFWVFGRNIDRIEAQKQLGSLEIANKAQSSEATQELFERLVLTLGEVVEGDVVVEPLDREGLDALKNLG